MRNFLEELNRKQYEAVTSTSQFLRIIAGAGSGKTRVLTYRIAFLLENLGVSPWNILAITFTNKVANEMRERASALIGKSLKDLTIKTFHGFCAAFLRREISNTLGYPSTYIIYDEKDCVDRIKDACIECGIGKKDKMASVAESFIYAAKGLGLYPNDIKSGDLPGFENDKKCLEVYRTYESLKFDDKALDFDDLILKTIHILKFYPEIRAKWSHYFKHILVDEFQDTNDLQYELLTLLMNENTSLYVVGDPDQTIYTWRGANQNIILDMNKTYPGLNTVILDKNYRSTKTILDHSNRLISKNRFRVKKDLITENELGNDVDCYCGYTRNEEADWVSKQIIKLKASEKDFSYNDVAVLYRSAYVSSSFENQFMMSRIPYIIYGGLRFYQRKEVKIAIFYLRLLVDINEDFSFFKVINEPKRKIGEQTAAILQQEAKENGHSGASYIKNIEEYPNTKLKFSVITSLTMMINKIEKARLKLIKNEGKVIDILKDYFNELGLEEYLIDLENGEERVQNVRALLDQIDSYFKNDSDATLRTYLENVSLSSAQDEVKDGEKVKLMTIHTAKGLEFKYVFVVGVTEGSFPSRRTMDEDPVYGLEEERRLCYVSFTRAMKRLFVTCNSDFTFVTGTSSVPSRFFKEADLSFYKKQTSSNALDDYRFRVQMAKTKFEEPKVEEKPKSNIDWNVGDVLRHNKFGVGRIISIKNDVLEVDFDEHGIKKIISYYVGLEKIKSNEVEL